MSKEDKLKRFNPSENFNRNNNIFGLPFNSLESKVILLPVPWDVTSSGKDGTCKGPEAIFNASFDIDLYDDYFPNGWMEGISMEMTNQFWLDQNNMLRYHAKDYLQYLFHPSENRTLRRLRQIRRTVNDINLSHHELNNWVKKESKTIIDKGKIVGVVGGDHSAPLGLLQALAEEYNSFGILQIDAHADLRHSYERFRYSHASIMHHAIQLRAVSKLVQIGLRDFCQDEKDIIDQSNGRIVTFTDRVIKQQQFNGVTWDQITNTILKHLPEKVYISFDIDGLSPELCPNAGTPVPGGFQIEEVFYLFEKLSSSGKKIIGFDLCEVSPGQNSWDEFVGAKALYKLALSAIKSNM